MWSASVRPTSPGGVSATEHPLALGHLRIAHAGGPVAVDCSQARLAGYSPALRRAGIVIDETLITTASSVRHRTCCGGRSARSRRPADGDRRGNDEIAFGLPEEARRRAVRVPQELSLVGFDDTFMSTRSAPPLTTVSQPLADMGASAVRSLIRLINHEPIAHTHVELATTLVVRDSSAAPTPQVRRRR